jgi:hypothetical protein
MHPGQSLTLRFDAPRQRGPLRLFDGWMLLECQVMDGSRLGSLTILPYGPNNTFARVPDHPISPRGLASDMSVVVGVLPAENLPS